MAKKKKGSRVKIGLVCSTCKNQNYVSEKNRLVTPDSIKLNKYCKKCNKKSPHNEVKKLH